MNRNEVVLAVVLLLLTGCASAAQSCGIPQGGYAYSASGNVQASAQLQIAKDTISFSAGMSDGSAPVAATDVTFVCNKKGYIDFSFVDERGNDGRATIKKVGNSRVILTLTPVNADRSDFFSSQILRNYGEYEMEPMR